MDCLDAITEEPGSRVGRSEKDGSFAGSALLSKSYESLFVGKAATCTMEGCWRLSIWRTLPSLRIHTHPELGSMRCSYLWSCLTMSLSGHRTLGCDIFVLGTVGGWHTLGRGGNWNRGHWALCMVEWGVRLGNSAMATSGSWLTLTTGGGGRWW